MVDRGGRGCGGLVVAWHGVGVEDCDGSLTGIGMAWRIKWVFVLFVIVGVEDQVGFCSLLCVLHVWLLRKCKKRNQILIF